MKKIVKSLNPVMVAGGLFGAFLIYKGFLARKGSTSTTSMLRGTSTPDKPIGRPK